MQGTKDLGLFYKRNQDLSIIGYADAGYLSDPHDCKSQTGYVFLCGGTAFSWKSPKQTLVSTSTNHSENHGTIRSVKRVCIASADGRPHSADMWAEHRTNPYHYL